MFKTRALCIEGNAALDFAELESAQQRPVRKRQPRSADALAMSEIEAVRSAQPPTLCSLRGSNRPNLGGTRSKRALISFITGGNFTPDVLIKLRVQR